MITHNNISTSMMEYLKGRRAYHVANWKTFIANPVGVAEHGDYMETLEGELEAISKYDELIATLEKLEGDQGVLNE